MRIKVAVMKNSSHWYFKKPYAIFLAGKDWRRGVKKRGISAVAVADIQLHILKRRSGLDKKRVASNVNILLQND
ncbi:hypothetical protein HA47_05790 [Pantoea stewartii subsp. indologenes]|nr:hypothetical protein HA47_05790 [Pantoea stewartii subsp. indologenes]